MKYITVENIERTYREHYESFHSCLYLKQAIQILSKSEDAFVYDYKFPDAVLPENLSDDQFLKRFNQRVLPVLDTDENINPQNHYRTFQNHDIYPGHHLMIFKHINFQKQGFHSHNYFEIIYCFKGSCKLFFENDFESLSEGDICIISPGSIHELSILNKDSYIFNLIMPKDSLESVFNPIFLYGGSISLYLKTMLSKNDFSNYLLISTHNNDTIKFYFKCAVLETEKNSAYSQSRTINFLSLFFSEILESLSQDMKLYNNRSDAGHNIEFMILQYIEENYLTLTLKDLSDYFHYNEAYLSRLILQNTGKNFKDIILEKKMDRALFFLKETDLSITEIAEICGYNGQNYFSKAFRKKYHQSPSEYRTARDHDQQH